MLHVEHGSLSDWTRIARLLERCFFPRQQRGRRGRLRSPYLLMKRRGVVFLVARDAHMLRGVVAIRKIGRHRYLLDNAAIDPVVRTKNWALILRIAEAVADYLGTLEPKYTSVVLFASLTNPKMAKLLTRHLQKRGIGVSLIPVSMYWRERLRYSLQSHAAVLQLQMRAET